MKRPAQRAACNRTTNCANDAANNSADRCAHRATHEGSDNRASFATSNRSRAGAGPGATNIGRRPGCICADGSAIAAIGAGKTVSVNRNGCRYGNAACATQNTVHIRSTAQDLKRAARWARLGPTCHTATCLCRNPRHALHAILQTRARIAQW